MYALIYLATLGSGLPFWLGLLLVIVIGGIALIARSSGRR